MPYHSYRFAWAILCVLLLPIKCLAADNSVLARRLVVLLRFEEQFQNDLEACLASSKAVSPAQLLAKDPDSYYGLGPSSPQWPEVLQAYDQYFETVCSHPTKNEFLTLLVTVYAEKMSVLQLKSAIQFYSSPVGQKLVTAHKSAAVHVNTLVSLANTEQVPNATAEYNRRIKAIADTKK
jgi:hypothetical protein